MKSKGNEKCPCGSGKLFKNCCKRKSPVNVTIDLDQRNLSIMDGVAISSDGKILGHSEGKIIPLIGNNTITYRKAESKRKKALSEGLIVNNSIISNPDSILTCYKHVFAVDTNTRNNFIESNKVSVASMIHCLIELTGHIEYNFQYSMVAAWEFWNLEGNEERFFWKYLIDGIENGNPESIYKTGKIAILTDCDLTNHKKYNNREIPIYEDFYLPERYTIIYATSDSSRDLPNKLIRKCDGFSADILKIIQDEEIAPKSSNQPFTHLRMWNPHKEDKSWFIDY